MICMKCQKEMSGCRCPDAIERLKWLLSSDSPIVFSSDQFNRLKRHMTELQGERELRRIGR